MGRLSIQDILEEIEKKINTNMDDLNAKASHMTKDGVYDCNSYDWWTSGFWPGMLWVMYEMTGKDKYKNAAWDFDEKIETLYLLENRFHHDVGFQFLPTAVIKYKITGDEDARRRGLFAANFLAGRFNIAGKFIRAWNQVDKIGWSIIDTCMNLSLLFWASAESGDPRFKHIAVAHADTVIRDFIREDGSVKHVVCFDPETGEVVDENGGQGYGPGSSWSRGQAWAIYGMANCYKSTGDIKYLKASIKVAKYFISCLPEDNIAYWDFRLPSNIGEPRDTSAAACAASGMLEIAECLSKEEGLIYKNWAEKILFSLTENYSTFNKPEEEGILTSATSNKPGNVGINVSLIYGDYFFIEGISKLLGWKRSIF
ncbi:glycoside hydrolase family 88 protein [Clostridium lacusfryxellense]|uniref:glycoside hydrolase family 88 protein n=1 Tax=Clostridium lacusfryxellense TaxID=205328 RepID=UPI001C0B7075|nr:glycoside hydrolase family 88 protein [Clostridium lacusfryxellense]MBU3110071.1 glycoside hydrolase family 88 protein [Clostridium lacusfryxellense]